MKLFDIIRGRQKASAQYRRDGGFVSRWARPPSRNTAEWLDMFSKSPRLAVVERIASDLANLSGHLYRIALDGSMDEVKKHPFLDLLEHPNPLYEMTSSAVWRLNEIYLMLVGESFMLVERDEYERPVELWNVPPHWVKMTPYLGNPGYQITSPGGLAMTVSADDMFVMKQLNPLDPYARGLGVAESIADEVEIDEYAAKFQKRFFYNDATPPTVFIMPDATRDQLDTFMAGWNKRYKGVENSHKAAALTGNVTVHELGNGEGKNLGFLESRLAMRDSVLEHFGVPREIMGITENSNRATADAAQYIYAKNVLTPRISNREQALNMQLLAMYGDASLVWKFDPVIPYDKEFDKSRALEGWNAGLLTKNEARGLLDMPGIDGGDVYKTSITDLFLREGDDPAKVSQAILQPDSATEVPISGRKSLPMNITDMLLREEQAVRKHSRSFEAAISRHFDEQRSEIQKALGLTRKTADTPAFDELEQYLLPDGTLDMELWNALEESEQLRIAGSVAAGLLNWKAESKKLQALFMPLWKETYEAGAKLAEGYYGISNISRPGFVTAAKVNGAKRIVGIEQTTRDSIADIIADGIANGSSQATLKKAVFDEMDTSHRRAKLIARQETMMALATGQFDMMKAAGAKTKTWHHRDQENPRDGTHGKVNHVILEGETVDIDEKFSNGLRYPRDPEDDRPEQVINCRCYLTFSFEDVAGKKPVSAEEPKPSRPEAKPPATPARLGQGSSGTGSQKPGTIVQTGTVDFKDKSAVLQQLKQSQADFGGLNHEMNCTVTSDGKVWRVSGTSSQVNPWGIEALGSSLRGSYSYHNHPAAQTWYSFSAADVRFFFSAGETFSMASDDAYEYVMRRTKETLDIDAEIAYHRFKEIYKTDVYALSAAGEIDIDRDGFHEAMKRLSKEYGFSYERVRLNGG